MKIVIPSGSPSNLSNCLPNIYRNTPNLLWNDVVVVNDTDQDPIENVTLITGRKPFNFSSNVNWGVVLAQQEKVGAIVMGDDVLLNTFNGFELLMQVAKAYDYGILSPGIQGECGNQNQHWQNRPGIVAETKVLCFICVYISAPVLQTVGLMDERFTGYGYDDIDYCKRVMSAGFKLGVWDGVKVTHKGYSVYRNRPDFSDIAHESEKIFKEKYG